MTHYRMLTNGQLVPAKRSQRAPQPITALLECCTRCRREDSDARPVYFPLSNEYIQLCSDCEPDDTAGSTFEMTFAGTEHLHRFQETIATRPNAGDHIQNALNQLTEFATPKGGTFIDYEYIILQLHLALRKLQGQHK